MIIIFVPEVFIRISIEKKCVYAKGRVPHSHINLATYTYIIWQHIYQVLGFFCDFKDNRKKNAG